MARGKRICFLCGTKYEYCPTCAEYRNAPAFMSSFHNENCKNIFQICTDYNMGLVCIEDAQKALSACDLTDMDNFVADAQKTIEKLTAPKIEVRKPIVVEKSLKEKVAEKINQYEDAIDDELLTSIVD